MAYTRHFITLDCEASGFARGGKTPTGRCLLESRSGAGKLLLWAQDLSASAHYQVSLIFGEGTGFAGVAAGALKLDASGKAEFKYNFDADNVGGFGFSLANLVAVSVMTKQTGLAAVLSGYMDTKISWLSRFSEARRAEESAPAEPVLEPPTEEPPPVEEPPVEEPSAPEEPEAEEPPEPEEPEAEEPPEPEEPENLPIAEETLLEAPLQEEPSEPENLPIAVETLLELSPEEFEPENLPVIEEALVLDEPQPDEPPSLGWTMP